MSLTDNAARNAKPAAKTVRMFDRDGRYLEVSPRGGKWWRLKYRYAGRCRENADCAGQYVSTGHGADAFEVVLMVHAPES